MQHLQSTNPAATPVSERFRVACVFGTRPEIIKFAPVIQELRRRDDLAPLNICTSQHTDLALPFLAGFGLELHHDLQVMRPGQSLNLLASRVLAGLDGILEKERPDFLLVQGDTTSALAGAMAAFQRDIPVGHIEAGLRSGDPRSPFPEEMNRRLISRLATVHFAATERNRKALLAEGVAEGSIFVTGNPIVDALQQVLTETEEVDHPILRATEGTRRIVLTAHRRENFASNLEGYFKVLRNFVEQRPDVSLIFPVHPNPNVRELAARHLEGRERIHLLEPMPYPAFMKLLSRAWLIVSDSGGIQEEAPTLGVPLLIIRENTERPESIDCGAARLIGEDPKVLAAHLETLASGAAGAPVANPFGDGRSAVRIIDIVASALATRTTKGV
ncbi:MAG: UDP-N-acetylglucosamine 2-epimerase (non-hydrolyzing) [Verrucomicrobia bacterium]|nr:UDP-N-acetylglucosamine 2-epimerase (non-hydrolyzing) [Verrucomicrobiota bacterium]